MALEVDIYQRTICCHPIEKVQEKVVETPPSEELSIDEEVEAEVEEEPLDVEALMAELDCMKRRIQILQLRLKAPADECPSDECVDYEVLLNCSENKEICALQKNHHKLQCQVNELVKCCRVAKDHIKDLRFRMCQRTKEIAQLQKQVDVLMQWRNTLDHEFGKCIERFEYLKHVKAEWQNVVEKFDEQKQNFTAMAKSFVQKVCYEKDKKSFLVDIKELGSTIKDLYDNQLERFGNIERRIDNMTWVMSSTNPTENKK